MSLQVTSTSSQLTKPVNAVFEQTFLRRAQQVCPYFVGSTPGDLNKQMGTSTIKWRRIEQLSPTNGVSGLTELTGSASFMMGRNADTPTFTDIVATVAKYGQFYIVNEEVDLYNPNQTGDQLVATLGEAAGRALNQLMRNVVEGSSTLAFAANVASTAAVHAKVATTDFDRQLNTLVKNSARVFMPMTSGSTNIGTAPILQSYWAFCHPDVANDIAGLTGFKSVETYGMQTAITLGEFGYYAKAGRGIRFIQSEDASVNANAGAPLSAAALRSTGGSRADTYYIPIIGEDATGSVGLGMRHTDGVYRAGDNTGAWEMLYHERGTSGVADPFNEIATLAYKAFFAGAILNTNWSRSLVVAAGTI